MFIIQSIRRALAGSIRAARLAPAFVAAAILLAPAPAHAQMGAMRAMNGMRSPNINARNLKQFASILGLNDEQRKAADELLSGYSTEYLGAVKRLEEVSYAMQDEFASSGDMEVFQEIMPGVMKKFQKKIDSLEKGLMDDLKALLDQQQLQRWPLVERLHRRNSTINWGSLSGECVNLAEIVDGLRLDPAVAAPLSPTLEQYEVDLDRELIARNKLLQDQMDKMWDNMMGQDPEGMMKQFKDMKEAGRRLVDVNNRYARQLQSQLPTELQKKFDAQVKLVSLPKVYRKSYAQRILDAAEAIPDLDATQKEGLHGLREAYERDAGAANEKWAGVILDMEKDDSNPMAAFGMWGMGNQEGPLKDAKDARKAIDDRSVEAVKALLSEPQRARLPDKKNRPEFDFDGPTSK